MSGQTALAQNGDLPEMNDDEVLKFTRGVRVRIIGQVMHDGKIGESNSDRILVTNMLKDLDDQALKKKKIASDERNADNTAVLVAEMLRTVNKSTAFTALGGKAITTIEDAKVVPSSIPDMPALPGEMDVAPAQMDYATFLRNQGKDADQLGKNAAHPEAASDE
jgi:hypothetical protein